MTARIIAVDDEPELRDLLQDYLSANGFEVRTADGGEMLRRLLGEAPADLILLDVRMPGEDGLTIARSLPQITDAAVIMVTASNDVIDRIVGLEIGADDYVTKPFDLRELKARISAVLRRGRKAKAAAPAEEPEKAGRFAFGIADLDVERRRLVRPDGTEIPLTAMEFDLLHAFATHPNRVLNRDQLLDLAHNREWDPFDRSIDIRIARIRRKIEPDPSKPQVIRTIRGTGYMYVPGRGSQIAR